MATRKVKDAKDLDTGEKVYLKSHAKATYLSNGQNLEDALNNGEFLSREVADTIYQPKGNYLTEHQDISGKLDKDEAEETYQPKGNYLTSIPDEYVTEDELDVPLVEHGTGNTTFTLTPNVYHKWGTVTSLTLTLGAVTDSSVYNEYMFEFVSGSTATSLSLPATIKWVGEPNVETNKIYQCSIVNGVGVIASADNA